MSKMFSKALAGVLSSASCGILLIVAVSLPGPAWAQPVESLSQAKTLYVAPFGGGAEAPSLQKSFEHRLSKSRFRLVKSPKDADATVKGESQIWLLGYISVNPRTPSTNRQAVYAGYLSLEVVGADGQPLWSWLTTPSRRAWNNIVDDLAGNAAKRLVEAAGTAAAPSGPSAVKALAHTSLAGGGATFPARLYEKWFEDFEQSHPGVQVHYSPVGSQQGDERLVAGDLDFAGSDVAPAVAVKDADATKLRRFATVLGAVVPVYNIKGVTRDLRFDPETLADIYLGRVRRWNDPKIQHSNQGVKLPDAEIVVVHRSDGSGTTWVWSDFLSKVSAAWSSAVGRGTTLRWPVGSGAQGNEGVAEAVKNTPNSIGYVELTYAIQHQISFGAVRNRAGQYVRADYETVMEAAKTAGDGAGPAATITDAGGKGAYPISAFTWIVIAASEPEPAKRAALAELLRWALKSGQKDCASLGYVPLPREIAERELAMLNGMP